MSPLEREDVLPRQILVDRGQPESLGLDFELRFFILERLDLRLELAFTPTQAFGPGDIPHRDVADAPGHGLLLLVDRHVRVLGGEAGEGCLGTLHLLAGFAELTGVHLDYIRHPDAILPRGLWSKYKLVQDRVYPPFDYGYTPYSRDVFKKKHGVDPLELKDPASHKEWVQYRLDSVTDLVNGYLVPAARVSGKQITAAVFPGPTLARQMVYQDWGRWDLDGFLPMLFRGQLLEIQGQQRDFTRVGRVSEHLEQAFHPLAAADLQQGVEHRCASRGLPQRRRPRLSETIIQVLVEELENRRHGRRALLHKPLQVPFPLERLFGGH